MPPEDGAQQGDAYHGTLSPLDNTPEYHVHEPSSLTEVTTTEQNTTDLPQDQKPKDTKNVTHTACTYACATDVLDLDMRNRCCR